MPPPGHIFKFHCQPEWALWVPGFECRWEPVVLRMSLLAASGLGDSESEAAQAMMGRKFKLPATSGSQRDADLDHHLRLATRR